MTTPADDTAAEGVRIDVLRGAPTDAEVAALIAVVSEAYSEEAADAVAQESHRSAWELSQRGFREPLPRELGWARFGRNR